MLKSKRMSTRWPRALPPNPPAPLHKLSLFFSPSTSRCLLPFLPPRLPASLPCCSHVNTISRRVLGPTSVPSPLLAPSPHRSKAGSPSWEATATPPTSPQRTRPMSAFATATPSTRQQPTAGPQAVGVGAVGAQTLQFSRLSRAASAPARRVGAERPRSASDGTRCVLCVCVCVCARARARACVLWRWRTRVLNPR